MRQSGWVAVWGGGRLCVGGDGTGLGPIGALRVHEGEEVEMASTMTHNPLRGSPM